MARHETRRMRFYSLLPLILLAILFLVGCGGGGGGGNQQSPATGSMVIPSTTIILDNTTLQKLEGAIDNGSTLVFSGSTGGLDNLSVGNVIVVGVTSNTPNGLLRKVGGISTSGGKVVVSTGPATLEEAIETGSFSTSQVLSPGVMFPGRPLLKGVVPANNSSYMAPSIEGIIPLESVSLGTFSFNLNNVILYDADGNNKTTGDQVIANGEISFDPSFDLDFSIENHKLKSFKFSEKTGITSTLALTTNASLADVNKSYPIWESAPQVFTFMVGPVPVVITAKLQIIVGVNGQVSAGVSTSVTDVASITGGLQYNNGSWGIISNFSNDYSFNPPSAYITASLKGFVGPRLDLMLYAIAGPYAEIQGNLLCKGDINPTNTSLLDISLYGGIVGNVGAQVDIFSNVLANYSAEIFDYSKKLWENSINVISGLAPGAISVNPAGGSWTSTPQNLSVSSSNATAIYYTMVNTYDGNTPADPREPTSSDNDGSIPVSGGAGTFQLYATAGQNKQTKLRFKGYNSAGAGTASGVYSYSINLSSGLAPGAISVNPESGSWTSTPQNLAVSSSNATAIYYTMVNTYDGNTPADPREPTSSDNDGSIPVSGGAGTFQLYATAGQNKQSKLRFKGYNSAGAGTASGVYSYSINLISGPPPSSLPSVMTIAQNPNGSSYAYSPIDLVVIHTYATAIYFTMVNTYDGSTPADPRDPTSSDNDGSVRDIITQVPVWSAGWGYGRLELYANVGQYKRIKLRFRAYNSGGAGPASGVYSYTFNLIDQPGAVSVSPSSGNWTSNPPNLEVGSNNATAIYFTMVNTYDGSTPVNPREPTSSDNDGSIQVLHYDSNINLDTLYGKGLFTLYPGTGQYKRSKLRFRAYNSVGAGPASGVYSYSIDLR